jgi:hypothetical protein
MTFMSFRVSLDPGIQSGNVSIAHLRESIPFH